MTFLLDTNICIYIIKRKPERVFDVFRSKSLGEIGISSITLAELQFGVQKSSNSRQNQAALNNFLIPLEVLGFDSNAAHEYGKIREKLEKKGQPIGALDTLIAAHAMSIDAVLVTNNEREFSRVEGLNIENWIESQ